MHMLCPTALWYLVECRYSQAENNTAAELFHDFSCASGKADGREETVLLDAGDEVSCIHLSASASSSSIATLAVILFIGH